MVIDLLDSANHLLSIWHMVFTPSMTGKFKPQVMLPGMLAVYTGMASVLISKQYSSFGCGFGIPSTLHTQITYNWEFLVRQEG